MDLTLLAPQPSLSFPDWTTLLSGAPPYISGVTTNWFEGMSKLPEGSLQVLALSPLSLAPWLPDVVVVEFRRWLGAADLAGADDINAFTHFF